MKARPAPAFSGEFPGEPRFRSPRAVLAQARASRTLGQARCTPFLDLELPASMTDQARADFIRVFTGRFPMSPRFIFGGRVGQRNYIRIFGDKPLNPVNWWDGGLLRVIRETENQFGLGGEMVKEVKVGCACPDRRPNVGCKTCVQFILDRGTDEWQRERFMRLLSQEYRIDQREMAPIRTRPNRTERLGILICEDRFTIFELWKDGTIEQWIKEASRRSDADFAAGLNDFKVVCGCT